MSQRLVSLDYVRSGAALAVAVPHFFAFHSIGDKAFEAFSALAVEIFFVLSGYVLAPQLLSVMAERRPGSLGIFLVRRWMRTVPPYVIALCLMSALFGALGTTDFYRYLFYVQNFFRESVSQDYFTVAWSLSVEEWFYVAFPIVLLAASFVLRNSRARVTATAAAVAFILAISTARLIFGDTNDWGAAVRRVVIFRIDSIAFGFLLYLLVSSKRVPGPPRWTLPVALVFLGALAFWLSFEAGEGEILARHLFPFAASLFGAACIVCATGLEHRLSGKVAAIGMTLGMMSYSIYLFHTIFLSIIAAACGDLFVPLQFVVYVGLVGAFTLTFYHSIEKPILARRPSYRAKSITVVASAVETGKVGAV